MISDFYTDAQKALQAKFESQKLAQAMNKTVIYPEITDHDRAFIESRDMFFLASVDSRGQPTCSYKGGERGFVRVVDPRTIEFPIYDGNGMFLSSGNIQEQSKVGLLFIDFEVPNRLRVQGAAALHFDEALLREFPGADMVVRVDVEAVFVNCSRHIHKHKRLESSPYVPKAEGTTPYPQWKRIDFFQSSLAPRDSGLTAQAGGTISINEYSEKLRKGEA